MIKRIKIVQTFTVGQDNLDVNGQEFDAFITTDTVSNCESAHFMIEGDQYLTMATNWNDNIFFEVVAESDAYSSANLSEELDAVSTQRDSLAEELQDVSDELENLKKEKQEIKREFIKDGYCLVPGVYLDEELARQYDEEIIISPTELVAMCCSAQLEINKGDRSEKSLNVKLYKAMQMFASQETDKMIEAGSAKA